MNKVKYILPILSISFGLSFVSCEKGEETPTLTNPGPSTYTFTRDGESSVSYSGQTERIAMLNAIGTELAKVNTGVSIEASTLNDMFANENGAFATEGYTKDLKSKCASVEDQAFYSNLFSVTDSISKLNHTAAKGTAGLLLKSNSTSGYLLNENGLEMRQIILKGLMGSVFYYRAIEEYMGVEINSDDNSNLVEGKNYTQMEHHYDEAFGYVGIATDLNNFDTDAKDQTRGMFWGEYIIKRHSTDDNFAMPGVNSQFLGAIIAGRHAITLKDYATRDAAIKTVSRLWEEVCLNNALSYLEDAKTDTDPAAKFHHLSEAIGFLVAMNGHVGGSSSNALHPRTIAQSKVDAALAIVGLNTQLWDLSNAEIDSAIAIFN